jgi:hypothetical protein
MTTSRHVPPLAVALIVAGLAAAPAAPAASAEPLKGCFLSAAPGRTESVPVVAAGFTPGAVVDASVDGQVATGVRADASGRINGSLAAPHQPRGERWFTIELVERDRPDNAVAFTSRVTALAVSVRPRRAHPSDRVRWTGRGFVGERAVHAHYVRRDKVRRTVRLARPRGACGRFSVRRRQFPFRPSAGSWTVQIDQSSSFSWPPDSPFVRLPIAVRRSAHFG